MGIVGSGQNIPPTSPALGERPHPRGQIPATLGGLTRWQEAATVSRAAKDLGRDSMAIEIQVGNLTWT